MTIGMATRLASGDKVVLDGVTYRVKLNGNRVYMRDLASNATLFTVSRTLAEELPRAGAPAAAAAAPLLPPPPAPPAPPAAIVATPPPAAPVIVIMPVQQFAVDARMIELRALLAAAARDDVDVDALLASVIDSVITRNTLGGSYLVRITHIAGVPVRFERNGMPTDEYVLSKIGHADNYAARMGQFTFGYEVALRVDGESTMEDALKRMIPANWKRYYFDDAERGQTVLRAIGAPGNNGPTEWRVMRRTTYEMLRTRAPHINSFNWRAQMTMHHAAERIPERALRIHMGTGAPRVNLKMLDVY